MMKVQAVIFDLDGVIVSTDDCHAAAWRKLVTDAGIPISHSQLERCRGVSRAEAIDIVLEQADRAFDEADKKAMMERKNKLYLESIQSLDASDLLPGVRALLNELKERGVLQAIGSSSRNTPFILERIGLGNWFDAVADGNDIRRSKPDPEVFLLAAERLGIQPANCLVIEDADAGVEAAVAAGMPVVAVGAAAGHPKATRSFPSLEGVQVDALMGELSGRARV